jgi:hypothetical protein
MNTQHLDVLRATISNRQTKKSESGWQMLANVPYRLSLALRCIELGDAQSLTIWLDEINENRSPEFDAEYGCLVEAANTLLNNWKSLEAIHGLGSLLDYQHRLKSSPANIVGVTSIANAIKFQELNPRVSGDPYWSLKFG